MWNFAPKFVGPKRSNAPRRGADGTRKARRLVTRADPLEGRVAPTVNIAMVAVNPVDSKDNPIDPTKIYAGQEIYIQADFKTLNLPFNASYRLAAITDGHDLTTVYSKYFSDGAGGFVDYLYYHEFFGPIQVLSQGGPETIQVIVNPDRSVVESNSTNTPYDDNSLLLSFSGISTPDHLAFTTPNDEPPYSVAAGALFGLTVAVEDRYNNVVANDVSLVTVSDPDGSGLGGGNTSVSASNGYASFSGLILTRATLAGSQGTTLSFSRPGLTGVTSSPIIVTPAKATKLAITQEPNSGVQAGVFLGVQAAIEDTYGNVEIDDDTTVVTPSLASGAGVLQGPTGATAHKGLATFNNDLYDDTAGPITIALGSNLLTQAITSVVTVLPSLATQLVIQTEPAAMGYVGQPLKITPNAPPAVEEEDRFGNVETGDNSSVVTAKLASGAGTLQGAMATVSKGLATFANLADAKAETMSIRFSSGNLATATSYLVVVGKATPTVSWAPAPVAIGTGIGAAQLDAIALNGGAPVPGTFSYSPGSGTVFSAFGPQTLMVKFAPADASDYTTATATSTVEVLRATTTSLSASAATATYQHPITFTAAVSPAAGGAMPTGSVTFLDGPTILGSAVLDGTGHARFTAASLPSGKPSITARYSGDATYLTSVAPPTSLHVRLPSGGDFDGDGKADVAIFDQTSATFAINLSGGGTLIRQLGNPNDKNIPVLGDFDGDGKTDIAVFDQTDSVFLIQYSGGGSLVRQLGNNTHLNIPVAGDFDGDGKTDIAVFDQTDSVFLIQYSGGGSLVRQLGNNTHINVPVAGDFDGDSRTDVAVFDQTSSIFLIQYSGGGSLVRQLGNNTHLNIPVAGDFDGDGKTDLAVFDQTASQFLAIESGGAFINQQFGNVNDVNIPIFGDFDGDGRTDLVVFDQTNAVFIVQKSGGGTIFLQIGDKTHKNIPV